MQSGSWLAFAVGVMPMACSSPPIGIADEPQVVSVPPEAGCSFDARHQQGQNCCIMKAYRSRIGVDDAYESVVREYGFAAEARDYEIEGEAYPERFHGHRHDALPGQSYKLQGIVVPRSDAQLGRGVWLGLSLEKIESGAIIVAPIYCSVGGWAMEKQQAWHAAVQRSIRNTLPPARD